MRRLPVEPLLERIAASWKPTDRQYRCGVVSHAATTLGVDRRAIYQARPDGLSEERADRWAVTAGFHPSEIWPDWFDEPAHAERVVTYAEGWL